LKGGEVCDADITGNVTVNELVAIQLQIAGASDKGLCGFKLKFFHRPKVFGDFSRWPLNAIGIEKAAATMSFSGA
jgi:hypothetical protein